MIFYFSGCGNSRFIAKENFRRPKWNGNCTQCMACYQYCPTNAIQYGNCTKGKGQYHFEK